MSRTVTFIDTSVLVEVLKVPGKNQRHQQVTAELRERVKSSESMILPTAAIIETGNHIAQVHNGGLRRTLAGGLARLLEATVTESRPGRSTAPGGMVTC